MRIVLEIEHAGEVGAGILPYTDEVMIGVHSGDPGGLKGEFASHMQYALAEWFDGAKVQHALTEWSDGAQVYASAGRTKVRGSANSINAPEHLPGDKAGSGGFDNTYTMEGGPDECT